MKYYTLILLISSTLFAEYRAYQYALKDENTGSASKIITSTLNPRAYLSYNGIEGLSVDLMRTWICPGYTGRKKQICKSPYEKMRNKEL